MNEQELQDQQEEQRRIPIRELFFATAQIGNRVRYSRSTSIYRYIGRRNNTSNSPIYIEGRIGNRMDVDAADVSLI